MRSNPYYPYGTPAAFSGRGVGLGAGQLGQAMKAPAEVDVSKLPDPRTSKENAVKFFRGIMAGLAHKEYQLDQMYAQLLYAISLGVVDCDEVIHYNQTAVGHNNALQLEWDKFADVFAALRENGIYIPKEPPAPKLIAATVNPVRDTETGAMLYNWNVNCLSPGGPLDLASLRAVGPVSPPCEDVAQLGIAMPAAGPICGSSVPALVGCAIVVGGAIWLSKIVGDVLVNTLRSLTDTDLAHLQATAQAQAIKQDNKRLKVINECLARKLAAFQAAGKSPTPEELTAVNAECKAYGYKVVPDRGVPSFGRWGTVGLIVASAGAIGLVLYMWRRKGGGEPTPPKPYKKRRRPSVGRFIPPELRDDEAVQ